MCLFFACTIDAYADEELWANQALILGQPTSVQLLPSVLNVGETSGEIRIGDLYKVEIDVTQVIYGKFDHKTAVVELVASHAGSISSKDLIFVLIEVKDGDVIAMYWGVPQSIACVPREVITAAGVERDFKMLNAHTNELCTNTQWFR